MSKSGTNKAFTFSSSGAGNANVFESWFGTSSSSRFFMVPVAYCYSSSFNFFSASFAFLISEWSAFFSKITSKFDFGAVMTKKPVV